MKKHLTTILALAMALFMPLAAVAQDAESITSADIFGARADSEPAVQAQDTTAQKSDEVKDAETRDAARNAAADTKADDAKADAADDAKADDAKATEVAKKDVKTSDDKKADDGKKKDEDKKSWSVGATASFDLGLGAFTKHEYARKIRSRFALELSGSYTIPVIDVDVHAETGFSQWMSKAGGSNGQYEFRWADSNIGFSRNIWEYKSGIFGVSFDADLSFLLPTSTATINAKQYTTITPTLSAKVSFWKLSLLYSITYGHSFHKYTSLTFDPSEVDILSRSAGVELIGTHNIATGGVLTEIELLNQFVLSIDFIKQFSMSVGLGFSDSWTYDNGTITAKDEFTNPNARVGRGHTQLSAGSLTFVYKPIKYLSLSLAMNSVQPWKTADNKTYRFPWFDTVSPSKNYTKFVFVASFNY
ncbi:MAG: hypothetical protein IJU23_08495 [Proteobacteria bacterium]|nr:hypothetical protein [Pseudomonadota bacterium]